MLERIKYLYHTSCQLDFEKEGLVVETSKAIPVLYCIQIFKIKIKSQLVSGLDT